MIVTLAGHVDHGKTSLVRSLTGTDTDRLAEEKRRGLTIDLGFAYLETPAGVLGFVDVPGHHRFIHNMVAGVANRQFALLVIAADDGPMPQSREHLQILQLLGVQQGVIALTKIDRAAPDRIDAAIEEIGALTAGTFLEDAPIIPTSATDGAGIEDLKNVLSSAAANQQAPSPAQEFRLAIDRAFTLTGAGLIATGTVHSGQAAIDDTLHLFPEGRPVRVRGIRVQNQRADTASAGDRCALNLAGIDADDVRRGQWLCSARDGGSREFTLELEVLNDFPRSVRHWLPVHVYHASAHTTGHVALLDEARLAPGTSTVVEVVTEEPLLIRRDDRLVLRDQGLDRTLGGGAVVAVVSASGRRRSAARLQRLEADRAATAEESFSRHLDLGDLDLDRFRQNWSVDDAVMTSLLQHHDCENVAGYAVRRSLWREHLQALLTFIRRQHEDDSALQGLKDSELHGVIPDHLLRPALAELVNEKQLVVQTGRYSPAAHQVQLSQEESDLLRRVRRQLDQPQPPSLGDMAKILRQPIPQLSKKLLPLVAKKQLIKVSDSRYCLPEQIRAFAELAEQLGRQGAFTVREYRDAAGIGRNVAIEVLEYFDGRGFTRRNGNERAIAGGMERLAL